MAKQYVVITNAKDAKLIHNEDNGSFAVNVLKLPCRPGELGLINSRIAEYFAETADHNPFKNGDIPVLIETRDGYSLIPLREEEFTRIQGTDLNKVVEGAWDIRYEKGLIDQQRLIVIDEVFDPIENPEGYEAIQEVPDDQAKEVLLRAHNQRYSEANLKDLEGFDLFGTLDKLRIEERTREISDEEQAEFKAQIEEEYELRNPNYKPYLQVADCTVTGVEASSSQINIYPSSLDVMIPGPVHSQSGGYVTQVKYEVDSGTNLKRLVFDGFVPPLHVGDSIRAHMLIVNAEGVDEQNYYKFCNLGGAGRGLTRLSSREINTEEPALKLERLVDGQPTGEVYNSVLMTQSFHRNLFSEEPVG